MDTQKDIQVEDLQVQEIEKRVTLRVYQMDKKTPYKDIPFGVPLSALKELVNSTAKSLETTQEAPDSVYYLRLEVDEVTQ